MRKIFDSKPAIIACFLIAIVASFAIGITYQKYHDKIWGAVSLAKASSETPHSEDHEDGHSHAEDGHGHGEHEHAHSDENSLELSESGARNIGLTEEFLKPIELTSYDRTISVPSLVVDRPGRTKLPVSAAMTGLITHVHAVAGEAIESGDLILEMRLTHEDLVTLQKEYLQSLGERDVELKEIARLEGPAGSGAISPRTLLERQYNRDKLDSLIRSQREALKLHGLTDPQLQIIDSERRLLTEARILAPSPDNHADDGLQLSKTQNPELFTTTREGKARVGQSSSLRISQVSNPQASNVPSLNAPQKHLLIVQSMNAQKGQIVNAGDLLCILADYDSLLIEGQAFEAEARLIADAKSKGWKVSASIEDGPDTRMIADLDFGWIENEVNPSTRTLKFYVQLPNQIRSDIRTPSGQRYVDWEYRTGQRMQLNVPVEKWEDQIVVPVEGVVRDGIESYIFRQNGDHFDRVAIHERYRDMRNVVIENDGTLFPGDIVATRGAHQMQMALKNKAGGAVDPHAGHNH